MSTWTSTDESLGSPAASAGRARPRHPGSIPHMAHDGLLGLDLGHTKGVSSDAHSKMLGSYPPIPSQGTPSVRPPADGQTDLTPHGSVNSRVPPRSAACLAVADRAASGHKSNLRRRVGIGIRIALPVLRQR